MSIIDKCNTRGNKEMAVGAGIATSGTILTTISGGVVAAAKAAGTTATLATVLKVVGIAAMIAGGGAIGMGMYRGFKAGFTNKVE